jgi:hypothetical protein
LPAPPAAPSMDFIKQIIRKEQKTSLKFSNIMQRATPK